MLVIVKVAKQKFNETMENFVKARENDFYHVGGGKHTSGIYIKTEKLAWPIAALAKEGGDYGFHGGESYVRPGYTIFEDLGAFYRTSGGNAWGVIKKDGDCYGFYSGARSRVSDVMSIFDENAEVVEYTTSGPQDMLWYENAYTYCIRKGYKESVSFIANNWDPVMGSPLEVVTDLFIHWGNEGKDVKKDVFTHMLEGKDPEGVLLKTYRGKRFPKPSDLEGIHAAAWELLDVDTQERILKYAYNYI